MFDLFEVLVDLPFGVDSFRYGLRVPYPFLYRNLLPRSKTTKRLSRKNISPRIFLRDRNNKHITVHPRKSLEREHNNVNFVSPNITETCCATLTQSGGSRFLLSGTDMYGVLKDTSIIKVIELFAVTQVYLFRVSLKARSNQYR